MKWPWQSVEDFNVQTQTATFDNVSAVSRETQEVTSTVTINYGINPEDVEELARDVGTNWYEKLVPQRVQQAFKETTVEYATTEIAPNRNEVKRKTLERLRASLEDYSITIYDVNLENLGFPQALQEAITQKQVAEQQALAARQITLQRREEANQAREVARGQADANRLLAESLTPELIRIRLAEITANAQVKMIEALSKSGNVHLVPSGSIVNTQGLFTP